MVSSESIGITTHLSLSPIDAPVLAYIQVFKPKHETLLIVGEKT